MSRALVTVISCGFKFSHSSSDAVYLQHVTVFQLRTISMHPWFASVMPSCLIRTSHRLTDLWIYYVWIVRLGLSRLQLSLLFPRRIFTLLETYGAVDGLWSWAIFSSVDTTLRAFMPATRIGYYQAQPQLDTPTCPLSFVVIQSSVALHWPLLESRSGCHCGQQQK